MKQSGIYEARQQYSDKKANIPSIEELRISTDNFSRFHSLRATTSYQWLHTTNFLRRVIKKPYSVTDYVDLADALSAAWYCHTLAKRKRKAGINYND